jgi:gas vesicle protein
MNDRIYYSHDAEVHAMRKTTVLTALFLMLGLGVGTILALLFAPADGAKTRHKLARSMGDGLQSGSESIEPMVKRLEEQLNELRKSVEERLKLT